MYKFVNVLIFFLKYRNKRIAPKQKMSFLMVVHTHENIVCVGNSFTTYSELVYDHVLTVSPSSLVTDEPSASYPAMTLSPVT